MKTSADYLVAANSVVPRIETSDAISRHGSSDSVFVDVRDSSSIADTGTIAGALRIPRGMLEFIADENTTMHNPALLKSAPIYLVCGAGGQAALAGRTLIEMGYKNVNNVGGISDWADAGGPMEPA